MVHRDSPDHARCVQAMFDRIARRYVLMNSLMTLGRDRAWRRMVVEKAALPPGGSLLDVAIGTGDIALEALRHDESIQAIGADFSQGMMRTGRARPGGDRIYWVGADAYHLPFPDASFDAVVSGFLVRNVDDVAAVFREQVRVVRPGGRVVCLDAAPPKRSLLYPFIMFHFRVIIPLLGRLIAGDASAYTYLPDSIQSFKTPEQLAAIMREAGLVDVDYRRLMFGTMALHVGTRPEE
ncbi:MAG: ubiquinone/menaquinone biosynthesis methyltransferase [Anaerolineae bacterium]|nr:ubiquinone/menaquinone biosynthesis methyltransferase [Anaerolineae bacterium]